MTLPNLTLLRRHAIVKVLARTGVKGVPVVGKVTIIIT